MVCKLLEFVYLICILENGVELKLTNKTALITGASKGIGLAVAELFAAEGCHLHLAARNGEALLQAKRELDSRHGVKITIQALDLSFSMTPHGDAASISRCSATSPCRVSIIRA